MTTLSRQHIAVAVNPSAAQGAHRDYGSRLVEALRQSGRRVTELAADSYEHLEEMARGAVATGGVDALIVVGGDGTAQLGTNVCVNTDTPLGILPSGTGNDTAEGILGMPLGDVPAAIERLISSLDRPVRKIDAGLMTWNGGSRWFCSTMSAGFDALVNETVNQLSFPKGPSRYTVAMLIELMKLKPIHYTVTIDGSTTSEQAILTTIANNSQYGGGMKVCPDAKPDDGMLDIMMVRPLSRFDFIRIYPRVFKGTHVTDPRVVIRQGKKFRIDSPDLVGYSDGERIAPLPMDVEVAPLALPVLDTRP
jgi:diacylglycerol kinase (ATP)